MGNIKYKLIKNKKFHKPSSVVTIRNINNNSPKHDNHGMKLYRQFRLKRRRKHEVGPLILCSITEKNDSLYILTIFKCLSNLLI